MDGHLYRFDPLPPLWDRVSRVPDTAPPWSDCCPEPGALLAADANNTHIFNSQPLTGFDFTTSMQSRWIYNGRLVLLMRPDSAKNTFRPSLPCSRKPSAATTGKHLASRWHGGPMVPFRTEGSVASILVSSTSCLCLVRFRPGYPDAIACLRG